MRLIDADKLELKHYIQRVSDKVIRYNGTQPEYANYDILAHDIANAPTVKAIPIEWIEKYKRVRGWEVTVTTQNAIDNMLNAWEKENDGGIE